MIFAPYGGATHAGFHWALPRCTLFKIARADSISGIGAQMQGFEVPDLDVISHYCRIEPFEANLATGAFQLYELAAMRPSSFCFSTTIVQSDGSQVPVMCIGESSNFTEDGNGAINGVFVFPKFNLLDKAPLISQ